MACPVSGQEHGEGQGEASPDGGRAGGWGGTDQPVDIGDMGPVWSSGTGISISQCSGKSGSTG